MMQVPTGTINKISPISQNLSSTNTLLIAIIIRYTRIMAYSCHCFYKLYVCKHVVRVAELYDNKLKGYNKIRVFAVNSKRGPKPKKKQNCLTFD